MMIKALIRKKQFDSPEPYERIQGIIDYMNTLREGFYTDEELDQLIEFTYVYYVDYYLSQVSNGGLLQFFLNSGFNTEVNSLILSGLIEIQATHNYMLFQKAIILYEKHKQQINSFEETYETNIFQEFAPLFNELDEAFFELNNKNNESIFDKNYHYIETINGICILEPIAYDLELQKILAATPNLAERKKEAEQYALENEPPYIRICTVLCNHLSFQLISVNLIDEGQDIVSEEEAEKNFNNGCIYIHITTDKGYYYIIADNQEAKLVNGDSHQIVGSMLIADLLS